MSNLIICITTNETLLYFLSSLVNDLYELSILPFYSPFFYSSILSLLFLLIIFLSYSKKHGGG